MHPTKRVTWYRDPVRYHEASLVDAEDRLKDAWDLWAGRRESADLKLLNFKYLGRMLAENLRVEYFEPNSGRPNVILLAAGTC